MLQIKLGKTKSMQGKLKISLRMSAQERAAMGVHRTKMDPNWENRVTDPKLPLPPSTSSTPCKKWPPCGWGPNWQIQ